MDQHQKRLILGTSLVLLLTFALAVAVIWADGQSKAKIFYYMYAIQEISGAFLLLVILLGGIYLATKLPDAWPNRILHFAGQHPIWIAFLAFFLLTMGAHFFYYRHPLSMDEFMPYFQSRIFSEGKLWGEYPPALVPWIAGSAYFAVLSPETGRVISDYWPGFALLLTPFTKIGLSWILNPLISAATLFLLYRYAKKVFPEAEAAPWVLLLTLASSVFMANGISYYTMSAHLFFNLLYAFLLLRITPWRLFLAGVVGSFAMVLHNPVPHMAFAIPWIIWLTLKPNRLRNLALLIAGYLPIGFALGLGWMWLKIFLLRSGEVAAGAVGASVASGDMLSRFLARLGDILSGRFSLPDLSILQAKLYGFLKIFTWSVPGLPILAILGARRLRQSPHLALWGWSAVLTLAVYIFVPFDQGHGWGYRYFHSAWLALPLLATAFLLSPDLKEAAAWKKYVCVLALLSLVFCTAQRFAQIHDHIGGHLAQLPLFEKGKNYLCILNVRRISMGHDLIQNDPFLRNRVILLESQGEENDQAMVQALFPGSVMVGRHPRYALWEIGPYTESIPKSGSGR